jgi:hypothetical protein
MHIRPTPVLRQWLDHFLALVLLVMTLAPAPASAAPATVQVGVAKIDVTPKYPVRLSGYGNRRAESEGVVQPIYAKALALGSDADGPAVLITVDNVGVGENVTGEVARRLAQRGVRRERFAVSSSHTHSAPMLRGVLPFLFGTNIPPEHLEKIDRYTSDLTDAMEKVALAALQDRRPGSLSWGITKATFGANRRTKGGPADHDVPVLKVADPQGKLRAVFLSYACHCTTVTGEFNQICGDWAGFAQEILEAGHPGAIVLTALGCGADQNPFPRPGFDLAKKHGGEIATAVDGLLEKPLKPVTGKLSARTKQISLPYDTLPTRAQWEELAKKPATPGYHARKYLERLDRGEKIPTELPYLVQVWNFGDDLAMVFLPGEVVVDYSLRLKKEFDPARLWVNAYSNDVPCYIPSLRVLKEGGYEGGGAMTIYDRPTKFAPQVEELIISAVHELMPKQFVAK